MKIKYFQDTDTLLVTLRAAELPALLRYEDAESGALCINDRFASRCGFFSYLDYLLELLFETLQVGYDHYQIEFRLDGAESLGEKRETLVVLRAETLVDDQRR